MIQADGHLAPEELDLLAKIVVRLELRAQEQAIIGRWLTKAQRIQPEELKQTFQTEEESALLIRALVEMMNSDSQFNHSEVELLNRLVLELKNGRI